MAYIVTYADTGEMVGSGYTRWQVLDILAGLGLRHGIDLTVPAMPRFGQGLHIGHSLTMQTVGRRDIIITHK